jgi:hypothetical protein
MPRYLLAIITDDSPEAFANTTPEQLAEVMNAYNEFTQGIRDDGSYLAGEALQPSSGAKVVRVNESGETVVTDGPFAETKEQLGGYYLVDAADIDAAAAIGARIPGARVGAIEVREVMEFPEFTDEHPQG